MNERSLRGKVAIVGIGETTYYKHGMSPDPEFVLAIKAILAACADAGIDPTAIDSFASYSNDRNDPSRISAALGCKELRVSNMQWGGGGGGAAAAVGNAAAAILSGQPGAAAAGIGSAPWRRGPRCATKDQKGERQGLGRSGCGRLRNERSCNGRYCESPAG